MFILFYILILFFEAYTVFMVIFVLVQLVRKKKIPWRILLMQLVCLILFYYLKYLVGQHKIIFIGNYVDGTKDWGSGFANVMIYTYNLVILASIFLVTQIIFWIFYIRKSRALNVPEQDIKNILKNFLHSEESPSP